MTRSSHATGAFQPGDSLTGPGKHLVFVSITPDALTFREEVDADAPAVPQHLHLTQSERLTVLEGVLVVTVAGASTRMRVGDTILVPPGTPHSYASGGREPLRIEVTLSPALQAPAFFAAIYRMQRAKRLPPRRLSDALALADLCHRHGFYLAAIPLALQLPLMASGALMARLAGVALIPRPPVPDLPRLPRPSPTRQEF